MKIECFSQPLMLEIGGALSYINVIVTTGLDPKGTLLCLHDLIGKGTDFQPLADILAAKGWKVIAPDFPGRGHSARVPSRYYTLGLGVDVAAAVLRDHPAQQTFILGIGWGATLALAVENTWKPAPKRIILCDLPLIWTYSADPRAQLWSQLVNLQAATDNDFMAKAQQLTASFPVPMTDVLDAARSRLGGPHGARSLGVDPGVFDILQQTADQPFAAGHMLRVSKAETVLLYSLAGRGSEQVSHLHRFMTERKSLYAEVSSPSFGELSKAGALLPILGAILR